MAPLVAALKECGWARCVVIATAQHRGLLDQMLQRLGVEVDHDLDLMTAGQTPTELVSRMLPALECILGHEGADAVLAQGDTTTVLVAALAAFHHRIPFGHVEAGLRTYDVTKPFPEEGYRQMVARIARWHFAPTPGAVANLQSESLRESDIYLTGNTGIDTLLNTVRVLGAPSTSRRRVVLLTAHRRENFGQPLHNIFKAVVWLVGRYDDLEVHYPVHPNPNVQEMARTMLADHPRIRLLPPQDYFDFVRLMQRSSLILTDSGGVQEEAPALAKPVLVLREQTERPEAVAAGVAELVGTETETIIRAATRLMDNPAEYAAMAKGASPYGDGVASMRIIRILRETMG